MTGGGGVASLRLATRLARRETVRRPGRTLLVALLVAVPVAGMVVASVWVRTDHQTAEQVWESQWGNADLYATPSLYGTLIGGGGTGTEAGGPTLDELLPAGTRTVEFRTEYGRVLRTTGGLRSSAEVTDLPLADPMVAPIMQVTSGRAPAAPGEVFLTRAVAEELGVGVGGAVRLERPEPAEWTVVGVGERRAWWGSETVVLGAGTPFPWRGETPGGGNLPTVVADLPDDLTVEQLVALSHFPGGVAFAPGVASPGVMAARHVLGDDRDGNTAVAWSWVIGAMVLTVVGIVIAAAFAAGARRQLATLGQLAANGAPPAVLRRVMFLQGTWTGLLGTTLGVGLAAAVLAVLAPHIDSLFNRDVGPYAVKATDLVPIVALGVLAATLAALVPARTTARIPVLAALAGRRPLRPVPAWLSVTGMAVGGAGLALLGLAVLGSKNATDGGTVWLLAAVVGGVAVLLGACAIAPGYVSVLEPLATRLRGSSRLAARSLARQRTRTGAVVSAVCATSALAVGASALVLSADATAADQPEWMRADEVHLYASSQPVIPDEQGRGPVPVAVPDGLLAGVGDAIPGAEVHQLAVASAPGAAGLASWQALRFSPDPGDADDAMSEVLAGEPNAAIAAIVDTAFLDLYDLPTPARQALADDGVVALASVGGTATITILAERFDESQPHQPRPFDELVAPFPVTVVAQGDLALGSLSRVLVTPERAQQLGFERAPGPAVVRAAGPLTDEQRTAVRDAVEEHSDVELDAAVPGDDVVVVAHEVAYPNLSLDPRLLEGLLTATAFVLTLFVVAVSLALAAAETRDERDVLVAVGAPPATMRRASGHKALLLTVLGAVLAVPVGFLPVAVFIAASDSGLPLVFPWRVVLLLLVAVPLSAAILTTAGSGLALRLRPVRVSTMAFD